MVFFKLNCLVLQKLHSAQSGGRNIAHSKSIKNKRMGFFGSMFGNDSSAIVKEMIDKGAVIIDVRTPAEFQGGHVAGSKNIPLQNIQSKVSEIKKMNKPVVLCCASGARSGQATGFLKQQGIQCENGGGWMQVNNLVR